MAEQFRVADILNNWRALPFEPFHEGIEVHYIQRGAPAVAILRYAPGASAPRHLHTGIETILVLGGTQSDENGTCGTGDFIVNPKGTVHSVWSDNGCAVLICWEKPVEFL